MVLEDYNPKLSVKSEFLKVKGNVIRLPEITNRLPGL